MIICDKRTENHNFTITTNTSQHVEFFHALIFEKVEEKATALHQNNSIVSTSTTDVVVYKLLLKIWWQIQGVPPVHAP